MAKRTSTKNGDQVAKTLNITGITVAGFKAIREEQSIELRPLTILAGANSSGKSSIMQPLLLLKQTVEAPYDPGALRLDGPNVEFSDAKQLLSRSPEGGSARTLHVGMQLARDTRIATYFESSRKSGFDVTKTSFAHGNRKLTLPGDLNDEWWSEFVKRFTSSDLARSDERQTGKGKRPNVELRLVRERCFLQLQAFVPGDFKLGVGTSGLEEKFFKSILLPSLPEAVFGVDFSVASTIVRNIIHLPGSRGNPARTYPVSAIGTSFPGRFPDYVASVVARWQDERKVALQRSLSRDLRSLGLSWKVVAKRVSDTEVELQVGRLPDVSPDGPRDLVSIADVGFGVSQALPVLVALHVATPEHLVYIEQPELHLHPRAQVAMAEVLARAVKRGVRMVIETHSALLLMAIQALVAEGKLPPESVILHWFTRSKKDGATTITTGNLDRAGAYGEWPEDFGDVALNLDKTYLDAAEKVLLGKK